MLCLFFGGWSTTQRAPGVSYLIRHHAAGLTQIRVLVLSLAVGTDAFDISVRQEFLVIFTVKLYDLFFINMSRVIEFLKHILYKCNVFSRACLVKVIKGYAKRYKVIIVSLVPVCNVFSRSLVLFFRLY